MDKRIKPYHEIYVNCYLNNFISVLSSINTSYKQLLNINNYVYNSYRNLQTNNQALRIRYDLDIYLEAFNKLFGYLPNCKTLQDFLYGDISFGTSLEAKSSNDIMRNLKSLLKDEGVIVFLAQDLFYLIQSNEMYYHKKHLTHYSMFVDYNEGTHCFMVFEMGARGYNCYHVPEENVVQSFSHAVDHPKCFYIKTPQKLDDYTLKTTNFKKYVPEIITSIDSVQYTDALWKIPASADDYLSYIEGVSKIVNRQEANKRLLESLSFERSEDSYYFGSLCTELKKGWEWIKNILIRAQFLGDKTKVEPCMQKCRILLNSEKVMWNKFLNCEVLK